MSDFREPYIKYRKYYQTIEPYLKSKRAGAYFMLFLSFLALSFFGSLAIRPTLKTIFQLKRQIKDSQFVNQKLDEKINELAQAKNEYQLVTPVLPQVYETLPKDPQPNLLLKDLEKLAKESGATISALSFQAISYSKPKSQTQVSSVDFTLTLKADYFGVKNFLDRVLKVKRIITFENLKITSQTEDKILSLYLKGSAYYAN